MKSTPENPPIFPRLCQLSASGIISRALFSQRAVLGGAVVVLSLSTPLSLLYAGSATWSPAPGTGLWNTASNWTPATVPNDAGDTATFGISATTALSISANTTVNSIVFSPGATAFTITAAPTLTLTISGLGIVNSSGGPQNFEAGVGAIAGKIDFTNSATAGSSTSFTNFGAQAAGNSGGRTSFFNNSTAGSGTYNNQGAGIALSLQSLSAQSRTTFSDNATAANGTFINQGGIVAQAAGGFVSFAGTATAGSATFTNNAGW
ncbi:MAG TPA: hypothetical protein VF593_07095 [Chthoniobacteraceae bacterium]